MYEKKVILTRFLHHFLQKMHIRQKYQTTGTTQQQLRTIVVLALSHAKGAKGAKGRKRVISQNKVDGTIFEFFFGFHGMLGTNGTKKENFYLISQSGTWRCRKACLRRNFWLRVFFSDYYGQKEMFSLDTGY